MKKIYLLLFTLLITMSLTAQSIFINELHYDNTESDVGEGFEIAGPAGTDLTGWTVLLYNGNGGDVYKTVVLSGTIDDEGAGYGALLFTQAGIQNGAPDGLALVDNNSTVIQFLSYEGVITATGGLANGITSTDIGVSESGTTPIGQSLQLTGINGTTYSNFSWTEPVAESLGSLNANQTFPTLSTIENQIAEFSIYPNPTSNGFVNIKASKNEAIQVAAYDILGKKVINTVSNFERLNVSSLKPGVYVLQLNQNRATTTKKLVIK